MGITLQRVIIVKLLVLWVVMAGIVTRSQKDCDRFRLAHWNARGGIRQKYDIIKDFLIEENIDVILIQETALPPNVDIKMRGYKQKKNYARARPLDMAFWYYRKQNTSVWYTEP